MQKTATGLLLKLFSKFVLGRRNILSELVGSTNTELLTSEIQFSRSEEDSML